ncbi:MAG: SAVED domain-containing protein [Chloroflexota bacterium]|nr:SAVED domain-containing protein [Chloroflexota bacterium]
MPTRLDTDFARLTDPDEFESLIRDICAFEWSDPNTEKFGRAGQKQHGVDVYGQPVDLNGEYRAAQCKLRTKGDTLTEREIEAEVNAARLFPHDLDTLIIATDAPRDTHTQILVDQISEREVRSNGFRVIIWSWDEITERLAAYPKLIVNYYKDYFANLTTLPIVERLVDVPLQVVSVWPPPSGEMTPLEERLIFRGARILRQDDSTAIPQGLRLNDVLPDGLMCQYSVPFTESNGSALLKFASAIRIHDQQVESNCPIFVLLPGGLTTQFSECFESLEGDIKRIQVITDDLPISQVTDRIFHSIFDYGYTRRGGLATIDIAARTSPSKPSSALLDLNWHTRLSISHFPTSEEWEDIFTPALKTVTKQIASLSDRTRIQISSRLPLPAAFALGFFLNIRVARVGVWARRTGVSEFKQQFWLSDGDAADVTCISKWVKQPEDSSQSAVVELTTYVSIHKAVEAFVNNSDLTADAWLQIHLDHNTANIDEGTAVAYAYQVGGIIRHLNAQGIVDIHLFARIPSALAVLVGQRLQACGRIHLYWFDNPTYRFAFTLK